MRALMRVLGIGCVAIGVLCVAAAYLTIKGKHEQGQRVWREATGAQGLPEPLPLSKLVDFDRMPEAAQAQYLGSLIFGLPGLVCLLLVPRPRGKVPASARHPKA
jgi:hypothetical protein